MDRVRRPRPSGLPAELTSFIGRRPELREVKRLLATTRLLTLIGGGAGKTRLALRAAAEMSRGFLASRSAGARRRCSPIVFSPVDRARGVYDRTHPYLVECGPEPAAVAGGIGALGQRRAKAVRQSAPRPGAGEAGHAGAGRAVKSVRKAGQRCYRRGAGRRRAVG